MNWLNEHPLTKAEAKEVFNKIKIYLIDMEPKNSWDAFINEDTFSYFIKQAFFKMENYIKEEIGTEDLEKFKYYPKIADFFFFKDCIKEDVTLQTHMAVFIKNDNKAIFELVENWYNNLFDEYLN